MAGHDAATSNTGTAYHISTEFSTSLGSIGYFHLTGGRGLACFDVRVFYKGLRKSLRPLGGHLLQLLSCDIHEVQRVVQVRHHHFVDGQVQRALQLVL